MRSSCQRGVAAAYDTYVTSERRAVHTHSRHAPNTQAYATWVAYLVVALPFLVAVGKIATLPSHTWLSGDLALLGLNTQHAMSLRQELGPFDRFGWNHPGPALFYLLALPSWLLGSGAKALFLGATLVNAAAACGVLAIVRRRCSSMLTLVAAGLFLVELFILTSTTPGSFEVSETAAGIVMSPWNATVIVLPFITFLLLIATAWDESLLAFVGALCLGSFLIQTDFSTAPVVLALVAVVAVVSLVRWARTRHTAAQTVARTPLGRGRWLLGILLLVFVLEWLPPLSEQVRGHPGNMTLIWRFFTSPHATTSFLEAWRGSWSLGGVVVYGPQEILHHVQGSHVRHGVLCGIVLLAWFAVSVCALVESRRRGQRFEMALCATSLIGFAVLFVSLSRVVGALNGYLYLWGVGLLFSGFLGAALLFLPLALQRCSQTTIRVSKSFLVVICVVASLGCSLRLAGAPVQQSASDLQVQELVSLVKHALPPGVSVEVHDDGAGSGNGKLYNLWRFFGLIAWLDANGYHAKTNDMWRSQLGSDALSTGHEPWLVNLETWTPLSVQQSGYVGKVGDMAVFVTSRPLSTSS